MRTSSRILLGILLGLAAGICLGQGTNSGTRPDSEHDASGNHMTWPNDEIARCPESWFINSYTYTPTAAANRFSLTCYTYNSTGNLNTGPAPISSCLQCIDGVNGNTYSLDSTTSNSLGWCVYQRSATGATCK